MEYKYSKTEIIDEFVYNKKCYFITNKSKLLDEEYEELFYHYYLTEKSVEEARMFAIAFLIGYEKGLKTGEEIGKENLQCDIKKLLGLGENNNHGK